MPLAEKAKLADYVIDNSGDRAATEARTREVYRALLADLRRRVAGPVSAGRSASTSCATPASPAPSSISWRPPPRDLVVEIGPGEGALTDELARRGGPRHRARGRSRS